MIKRALERRSRGAAIRADWAISIEDSVVLSWNSGALRSGEAEVAVSRGARLPLRYVQGGKGRITGAN